MREPSQIDRVADAYLDARLAQSPLLATYLGVTGSEDRLDDFSIKGTQAGLDLTRHTLFELNTAEHGFVGDSVDAVTIAALHDEVSLRAELLARIVDGKDPTTLNVLDCPLQSVRDACDLMATETPQQWQWILDRLRAVPTALEQYADALRFSAGHGAVVPVRQVTKCAAQCAAQAESSTSTYSTLIASAETIPNRLRSDLESAAASANSAFGALAAMLTDELLPQAPEADAVGSERYQLLSRSFLGTTIDLAETYAWGQVELARITSMMEETAEAIRPGATVSEAIEALDADEQYQLNGTAELKSWMQTVADEAIVSLADSHFDIPEPIRRIECMIAPSSTGIIYYTGPSEDFSRPGRMWWSVPTGVTSFSTWRELTTVYHEGVPGHHLQIAQTTLRKDTLNRWRRLASWTSGHGEGWALYAEWLMADLGYLDDLGMRMGLLDAQSMRAARVVLDIGVHCGFDAPAEVGGGMWTYDKAWQFLDAHVNMSEAFVRFELDRYLGFPGQAPSYKIGERLWIDLRDEAKRREGDAFDLAAFHRRALDIGGVGLDVLRSAVLSPS